MLLSSDSLRVGNPGVVSGGDPGGGGTRRKVESALSRNFVISASGDTEKSGRMWATSLK